MMLGKIYRRIWYLVFVRAYVGPRWYEVSDEEIRRTRAVLRLVGHR